MEIEIHQRKPVFNYHNDIFLLAEHNKETDEMYLQSLSHATGLSIFGKKGEMGLPGRHIGWLKAIVVEPTDGSEKAFETPSLV